MKNIILIGGGSSVGKTTLARMLGERLGLNYLELDHYLQKINDPELLFHNDDPAFWYQSAQVLCDRLVHVAEQAEPYIRLLVTKWLSEKKTGIIEGEQIHPQLAEQLTSSEDMRAVFVIESDPKRLYRILKQRSQRFRELNKVQQHRVVEMDRLFGLWLRSQAELRQLAWLEAQPWATLVERTMARLS